MHQWMDIIFLNGRKSMQVQHLEAGTAAVHILLAMQLCLCFWLAHFCEIWSSTGCCWSLVALEKEVIVWSELYDIWSVSRRASEDSDQMPFNLSFLLLHAETNAVVYTVRSENMSKSDKRHTQLLILPRQTSTICHKHSIFQHLYETPKLSASSSTSVSIK